MGHCLVADSHTNPGAVSVARAAAAVEEAVVAVVAEVAEVAAVVVNVSAAEMPVIRHTSIVVGRDNNLQ